MRRHYLVSVLVSVFSLSLFGGSSYHGFTAATSWKDRPVKGLRVMDVPVLLSVWVLCVATDWSTGTKVALNLAAVVLLCLKEFMVHHRLQSLAAAERQPAGLHARELAFAAA